MEQAVRPSGGVAAVLAAGALVVVPVATFAIAHPGIAQVGLTAGAAAPAIDTVEDALPKGDSAQSPVPGDDGGILNIESSSYDAGGPDAGGADLTGTDTDWANLLNLLLGPDFGHEAVQYLLSLDPGLFDVPAAGGGAGMLGADQGALLTANLTPVLSTGALAAVGQDVIDAEQGFNTTLVGNEQDAVQAAFNGDPDNADVTAIANHLLNSQNWLLYYQESLLNTLLGQQNAIDVDDLMLGGYDGSLSEQLMAALTGAAGLDAADWAVLAQAAPELFEAANFADFYAAVLSGAF